jgi:hypothetical protein
MAAAEHLARLTRKIGFSLCVTLIALVCSSSNLYAESMAALENGMTYNQVLKTWGPPSEKLERAPLREEIWVYDGQEIKFRQGKVILPEEQVSKDETDEMILAAEDTESAGQDVAVQDILSEIMDGEETEERRKSRREALRSRKR